MKPHHLFRTPTAALALLLVSLFSALPQNTSSAQPAPDYVLVSADVVPPFGTFYLLSDCQGPFGLGPSYPFNPASGDMPIYWMSNAAITNSYLVDDSSVPRYRSTNTDPPGPGDDPGGDPGDPYSPMPGYSYPSNTMWLEITGLSTGATAVASLVIHGSMPHVPYEILSRENLTNAMNTTAGWTSEGIVTGIENQGWTPASVFVGARTNRLWFQCRSWQDNDGDGLPDWWEQKYFASLSQNKRTTTMATGPTIGTSTSMARTRTRFLS